MILHLFLDFRMLLDIDSNNITKTIKPNYTEKINNWKCVPWPSRIDLLSIADRFFSAASDFHCLHSPSVINDYDGVYKFLLNAALEKKNSTRVRTRLRLLGSGLARSSGGRIIFLLFCPLSVRRFSKRVLQLDRRLSSYCFSFTPNSALSFQRIGKADLGGV